jgi:hypothetical protein
MAVLILALSVAVTVVLHALSARPRTDGFQPSAPRASPSQDRDRDRDRERLMAELRALGAADPPRLLS